MRPDFGFERNQRKRLQEVDLTGLRNSDRSKQRLKVDARAEGLPLELKKGRPILFWPLLSIEASVMADFNGKKSPNYLINNA